MKKTVGTVLLALAMISCTSQRPQEPEAPRQLPSDPVTGPLIRPDAGEAMGQTIYVPIYSHIYFRDKERSLNLAATLSIRNTDSRNPILVTSARYFSSDGKLLKEYAVTSMRIPPMAAAEIVINEDDTRGGSGASFVVDWSAGSPVTEPVVEAVMIGTAGQQGISFVSTGRIIHNRIGQ